MGICCASVIQKVMLMDKVDRWSWFRAAEEYREESNGRSAGNGGLMRTAYIGCYYKSLKDVEAVAWDVCEMTHRDDIAQTDCSLVGIIIHKLIDGGTKETIEDEVVCYEDCRKRYSLGQIEGYPFKIEPTGYCVDSLACALKCVLTTRSFKDAVVMAVNMGGDTDTIGAITGAIAGALYGIEEIPEEWIKALDKNVLNRIADVCSHAAINRLGGVGNVIRELCEKY